MAKQGDYYDEVLRRLSQSQRRLRELLKTARQPTAPANIQQMIYALRRQIAELTEEKYRTERGLTRRDIDLDLPDRPARKTGKVEAPETGKVEARQTGKTEVRPRETGKVEAQTGKVEAQTGKVEARQTGKVEASTGKREAPASRRGASTGKVEAQTGKVEARPRATGKVKAKAAQATGKVEAVTGKVEAKAARGLSKLGRAGKVLRGAGRVAGKLAPPQALLDIGMHLYESATTPRDPTSKGRMRGLTRKQAEAANRRVAGMSKAMERARQPSPPTVQPLIEKAMKYYPTALAQAAATAGHGSYQEIQRRYQPMMSNIIEDVRSRVTPMMSDDEVRGMLQRGVDDFVGRLDRVNAVDGMKPAGGVYRPGVSGPVPGSGMR